ncbi:MAG: tetratricopeptide repeat protein [Pseudomonadota bacterium]|nr:tetratricopeptide repeat protein [Pseudomonadota bacterium]
MTNASFKIKLLTLSLLALSGCSSLPQSDTSPEKAKEIMAAETVNTEVPKKTIAPETLYDLLIAEMGGKSNRLEIALGNYMRQAHMTKDPAVIERYAKIANYMQAHQATLDATELWLSVEPENVDALHLMLIHQIGQGSVDEQQKALQALLDVSTDINILMIEQQLNASSETQREAFKQVLTSFLKDEKSSFAKEFELWYLKAKSESLLGQYNLVISDITKLQTLNSQFLPGHVLLVDAYEKTGQNEKAITALKKLTKLDPENKKIRIYYARMLVKAEKLKEAKNEFNDLIKVFPEDMDIKLTYGVLSAEIGDTKNALAVFNELVEEGYRENEALLQIAMIQEQQDDIDEAINTLLQVSLSPFYQEARFKAAALMSNTDMEKAIAIIEEGVQNQPEAQNLYTVFTTELLAKQGQTDEALHFISKSIGATPDEPSLLYTRAILLSELDQHNESEKDLRKVLKLKPNNVAALNALGYALADQDKQLDEAEVLLEKALELSPNDPPIMDSMGWLKYRQGKLKEAYNYLSTAYEMLRDHEIAAHLGEVLWLMNKQEEAKMLWKSALEEKPDSKILKATMKRFM